MEKSLKELAAYHRGMARGIRHHLNEVDEFVVTEFLKAHEGHDVRYEFSNREFGLNSEGASELYSYYKLICKDDGITSWEISSRCLPEGIERDLPPRVDDSNWF